MIELIKKTIADSKILENNIKETDLDLLKYSRRGYENVLDGKVVFIVFEKGNKTPVLIVKTVRNYKYLKVISEGYKKLEELASLLKDTKHKNLFPKPLFLYDDGNEFIFSIESYNGGTSLANTKKFLHQTLQRYIDFQKVINKPEPAVSLLLYGLGIIRDFNLDNKDESLLNDYFKSLCETSSPEVSFINQHGDLTPDNIFIIDDTVKIIDCDYFGEIRLAGYDIYRLTMRVDSKNTIKYLSEYFSTLGLDMTSNKAVIFLYFLHDLLFKRAYILKDKSVLDVINGFKSEYNSLNAS